MKKLILLGLAIAGLSSLAATCVIKNTALTEINNKATFGAEMDNETTVDILGHRYKVAFLDSSNNVLEVKTVDGCLRSLQAGNSDFFSATSTYDKDEATKTLQRLAPEDASFKIGTTADGNISIANVVVTRDNEDLVVTGRVTNNGPDDLEDVRVCAVVYNDNDEVSTTQRDNDTYDLDDDEAANFSITVKVADDRNDTDTVDLWVDGLNKDEGDKPTEPDSKLNNGVQECSNTPTRTPTNTGTIPATNTPTATNTAVPTNTGTVTPTSTNTSAATNTPATAC